MMALWMGPCVGDRGLNLKKRNKFNVNLREHDVVQLGIAVVPTVVTLDKYNSNFKMTEEGGGSISDQICVTQFKEVP